MRVKNPVRTVGKILFTNAPLEAQLIITRRCNLSCGYCTEYDNFSRPIPRETLIEWIDALHRLNVVNIALLGGEPLLHPNVAEIVEYADRKSQVSMTTNGFLISEKIIEDLNKAGLSNMQVSIDALRPDNTRYIQKTMKTLTPKLERLKESATFDVHVNIVLCDGSKDDFKTMVKELRDLGFFISVNLIHDDRGMVEISGREYLDLWDHHYQKGNPYSFYEYEYGRQLLLGEKPKWKCRAGSRFLYVDEFGNAQFCSAQRGRLNKPITEYSREDLREHSKTYKGCEAGCSILCVYRSSVLDNDPIHAFKSFYQTWRKGAMGPSSMNGTAEK